MLRVLVAVLCLAGLPSRLAAQDPAAASPAPILQEVRLEGATIYKQEDVVWLLRLREGSPLSKDAAAIAKELQDRYERDGYSEARVTGTFENGRLTLTVDEGRIDDIEIVGVPAEHLARYRRLLGIEPGDIFNTRVIGRSTARLTSRSGGAVSIARPRRDQPGGERAESMPGEVTLERRGSRNVLVVPIRFRYIDNDASLGSGREDLFSPADGLSPAIGYSATIFDHGRFNHTYVEGYVSYKFGRDEPGYSVGFERPIFGGPRVFLGAETHDVTTSDDLWRLSSFEQALVSLAFKNSFRDYYRRRGNQVFGVLRADNHHEFNLAARWDRHEPLPNATSYSFFRDDAELRPALPVQNQRVNAFVIGYTFDTRPLTSAGNRSTYTRHLKDNLYGFGTRQAPGLRLEWTSEIAGHALGGDATFDRHILNARGHVPISRHSLLSMRGLFGFSGGTVPVERVFSLGGIGSVHGYAFKEVSGTKMSLLNAEYRINLGSTSSDSRHDAPNVFVFYDAGRVFGTATSTRWLQGTGVGFGAGGVRIEFGFRTDDIPNSRQILVRFSPTF